MVAAGRQSRPAAELCVGIVSVQGAVQPHAAAIAKAGAAWALVRHPEDLDDLDALILPGGESTTISKGLERVGLYEALEDHEDVQNVFSDFELSEQALAEMA